MNSMLSCASLCSTWRSFYGSESVEFWPWPLHWGGGILSFCLTSLTSGEQDPECPLCWWLLSPFNTKKKSFFSKLIIFLLMYTKKPCTYRSNNTSNVRWNILWGYNVYWYLNTYQPVDTSKQIVPWFGHLVETHPSGSEAPALSSGLLCHQPSQNQIVLFL